MGNTHLLITKLSMCEGPTIRSKVFLTFMQLKPLYRNGKISGSILSRKKALFSQCYSVYGNQVKLYYLLTATHNLFDDVSRDCKLAFGKHDVRQMESTQITCISIARYLRPNLNRTQQQRPCA